MKAVRRVRGFDGFDRCWFLGSESSKGWRFAPLAALMLTTVAAMSAQSAAAKAMTAEVIATGSLIVRHVEFDSATDTPTPGSEPALRDLAAMLQQHDEWTFEVQVHTDEGSTAAAHTARSTVRAKSVVAWLTRHGIASSRLVPRGMGSSRPLARAPDGDATVVHNRLELRKLNEE